MKVFRYVKKVFFIGLTILSSLSKSYSTECNSIELYFNEESRM